MQIRLYVDEDAMARALVSGLRARGVDVITVLDSRQSHEEHAESHGQQATHGI
jgi:hypothetical protein